MQYRVYGPHVFSVYVSQAANVYNNGLKDKALYGLIQTQSISDPSSEICENCSYKSDIVESIMKNSLFRAGFELPFSAILTAALQLFEILSSHLSTIFHAYNSANLKLFLISWSFFWNDIDVVKLQHAKVRLLL